MKATHFGVHLMIDGYAGDEKKLNDKKLILKILDQLPAKIKMKKIAKPLIKKAEPNGKKDCGGWSGYVLIAESHISCHTFPQKGFVSIDVYTCSDYLDKKFVIGYFTKAFSLKETEINYVIRGKKFSLY